MKTKHIYFILILAMALFGFNSCEKGLDEINKNPNAAEVVPTPFTLTYIQRELAYYVSDVWNAGRQADLCCQHWSQTNYTSEDRYEFRQNVADGFYRNTYIRLMATQDIISQNQDPQIASTISFYGDNDMQIATATIIRILGLEYLLETFGPIPYSQAHKPDEFALPAFDSEESVFKSMLSELDDAIAKLKGSKRGWKSGDVIYNGNISKWIKLANTMKLRLALRQSNVNPNWKAIAEAAIADGVFESNEDNAQVRFPGGGRPNDAPKFEGFISNARNDFTVTAQFTRLLQGIDDKYKNYQNPFNGIEDPRLRIFVGEGNYLSGRINGIPYGIPDAHASGFFKNEDNKVANMVNNVFEGKDYKEPLVITRTFPTTFLDYPTTCFMISEVKGVDAEWFKKGVEASMKFWKVSSERASEYVSKIMDKFNAADATKKYEILITQKYIHLFTQSFEAWSEYRRTGYPLCLVKPGERSTDPSGEEDGIFHSTSETNGDIVPRLRYDTNEFTMNRENYTKASQMLEHGDTYRSRLWWAKR